MKVPLTPLVASLPADIPFVGPESLERKNGREFEARLGANESAFGVSPVAVAAMREAVTELAWYSDPENHDLRQALARHHGVNASQIAIAAGIDDLLGLAVRAFVDRDQVAVASLGAYPTFVYHVNGFGCRLASAPYSDGRNDLDALADLAQSPDVRLVYLSNPDNPTGTWLSAADITAFADALPEHCVFILDEAYVEFAPPDAIPPLSPTHPRTIRMRTFSKAHGLAGARVGYAICPDDIAAAFDRIRLHFGVNRVAQAGARASLGDTDFVTDVVGKVAEGRSEYEALGVELGLPALPSATNFVSFDAGTAERADGIVDRLLDRGVFVRKPAADPIARTFRVTVGRPDERALFADRLRRIVAS